MPKVSVQFMSFNILHVDLFVCCFRMSVFTIDNYPTVNDYVTGSWSWSRPSTSLDWIGLYTPDANVNVDNYLWWQYVATVGSTSGTFTTATPASDVGAWVPTTVGSTYIMYYFTSNTYTILSSSAVFTAVQSMYYGMLRFRLL